MLLPQWTLSSNACIWLWHKALLSVTFSRCQGKKKKPRPFIFPIKTLWSPFYHGVVPLVFPYCCHCLQPWQQPKTFHGLQKVNIPLDALASQIYSVWCWIWIWVRTYHGLHAAWAKPSPCMDALAADARRFLSSHVTGCISYYTICFRFDLPLHKEMDVCIWVRLGSRMCPCQVCKYLFSDHVITCDLSDHITKYMFTLFARNVHYSVHSMWLRQLILIWYLYVRSARQWK